MFAWQEIVLMITVNQNLQIKKASVYIYSCAGLLKIVLVCNKYEWIAIYLLLLENLIFFSGF